MTKKAVIVLSILGFLLSPTTAPQAGRCHLSRSHFFNPQTDSYIALEVIINGLPSNFDYAHQVIQRNSQFFQPPNGCQIEYVNGTPRYQGHPYYECVYVIFHDTLTKPECWNYFRSLNTITVRTDYIKIVRDRHSPPEHWQAEPSTATVNLGPVQPHH